MTVVLEVLIAVRNALLLAVPFVAAWAFIDIRRMNKPLRRGVEGVGSETATTRVNPNRSTTARGRCTG